MATEGSVDLLTLAAIRKRRDKGKTEYLFNERQQVFTLRETTRAAPAHARLARKALRTGQPIHAVFDRRRPIISRLEPATEKEIEVFWKQRPILDEPERIVGIDVAEIDPTTFNIVDFYLDWRIFLRCTKTIPSYAKAKEIFDYCAAQSCHLPGPVDITPCIPFQYVIDGCYARAHKMRKIITTRYRYCCEKVFSFATEGTDRLSVQASKWGGCCVTWWYHVAPLVRVKVQLRRVRFPGMRKKWATITLAMVIDPSMFDKPVLLSTWLAAQEHPGCHPTPKVTSYSIQPGSAYQPSWGGGFNTDPTYAASDATCVGYSGLTTCP
jgi:hypothetical protein